MSYLSIIVSFLILYLVSSQNAKWGRKVRTVQGHSAKNYTIHLEDSYKQRWSQIMTDNKNDINTLASKAVNLYGSKGTKPITYDILSQYDVEYAKEIQAVAELLDSSINQVFWLNVMYEANAYCTSIVVQDDNGFIFQGRNLDYGFTKQIANIALHVDYYQNGTILFRANVLGGFIGFITAEKPGKFSISANQRLSPYVSESKALDTDLGRGINFLEMFLNKRRSPLMTIRKVMETANSYQDAIKVLSNQEITAPMYYIVAGMNKNEGAVLTMSRDGLYNITNLDVDNGKWFLVQTNYDRDVPDPANDNRRTIAEGRIAAIGRNNITKQNLLDGVLALYPNNNAITILSAVSSPKVDYFNITMWV